MEPASDEEDASAETTSSLGGGHGSVPQAGASPTGSAGGSRLGLHFSGGPGGGMSPLSWRDGRFADWTVQVGDKSYRLHAFLLARAGSFFESHMSMAARTESDEGVAQARQSDLTEVLPQSCHSAFEGALDFIYSENQSTFQAPASKALLLLKIADILGIGSLFEAMGRRIEAAFSEAAPLLLEQYCRFHIPGTDDGMALRSIRDGSMDLVIRKFQPFLANAEMHTALLQLPTSVLVEILEADDLLVASEDIVFDFVAARLEATMEGNSAEAAEATNVDPEATIAGAEELWQKVRWQYVGAIKFSQALELGRRLLRPETCLHALTTRLAQMDVGGSEVVSLGTHSRPVLSMRRPILPPGVPPPTSTEIDFCFHYSRSDKFSYGEALRSQPKRIGDLVVRLLVFPSGTNTGVAKGSLSIFVEAVPQPHFAQEWEFANIRYAVSCIRWPTGSGETWAAKRKSDLWTFKANRLDRGWHDFLAPGEIHRYLGPDGFVCIRASIEPECLGRTFLLTHSTHGSTGPGGAEAGSSASRRHSAPRTSVGTPGEPSE